MFGEHDVVAGLRSKPCAAMLRPSVVFFVNAISRGFAPRSCASCSARVGRVQRRPRVARRRSRRRRGCIRASRAPGSAAEPSCARRRDRSSARASEILCGARSSRESSCGLLSFILGASVSRSANPTNPNIMSLTHLETLPGGESVSPDQVVNAPAGKLLYVPIRPRENQGGGHAAGYRARPRFAVALRAAPSGEGSEKHRHARRRLDAAAACRSTGARRSAAKISGSRTKAAIRAARSRIAVRPSRSAATRARREHRRARTARATPADRGRSMRRAPASPASTILPTDALAFEPAPVRARRRAHLLRRRTGTTPARSSPTRARSTAGSTCARCREPYRTEGKKTMGLEIAEQLGWQLPDAVIYPIGGGLGAHRHLEGVRRTARARLGAKAACRSSS